MNLIDGLLGEYQHESAVTRRLLERVPENHFDFRPHKKSMNLGNLSSPHDLQTLQGLQPGGTTGAI